MTILTSPLPDVAIQDLSITERVFAGLAGRPDEVILSDALTGDSLTAAQFMDQVKCLATGLTKAGYGAGRTVALLAPNCAQYCVVFHGVAWAGGTLTTLNPAYTAPEVAHQIKDAGADVVITVDESLQVARDGAGDVPVIAIGSAEYDALFSTPQEAQVPVDLDAHTLVLPYSSGTTGLPKGVMLSHRNLVVNVDQTLEIAEFQVGEVTAAFLPLFHIYGMNALMNVHLAGGGALVMMPRFDLELFLRISQDYKARRMWTVPPVAIALAKHPLVDQFDLSALEQVFIAAAPSGAELSDAVAARLECVAVQGYGMTELSPVSHATPQSVPRSGSVGLLAPNTYAKIVDQQGVDLPVGETGELWVKGPQVMQGYLNNPAATAETITPDGWLRTGDIAYVDGDGYMFIVDRLKELIKYKGFQVAPAELEATLIALDGVSDAAVVGLPDEEAGELPIAFVVRDEGGPDAAAIHAHVAAHLATYKQLHDIRFVDAVPKSASGKILRRLLRDQIAAET